MRDDNFPREVPMLLSNLTKAIASLSCLSCGPVGHVVESDEELGLVSWNPRQIDIDDEPGELRDVQSIMRRLDALVKDCPFEGGTPCPLGTEEEAQCRGAVAEYVDFNGGFENCFECGWVRCDEASDNQNQLFLCAP